MLLGLYGSPHLARFVTILFQHIVLVVVFCRVRGFKVVVDLEEHVLVVRAT